ncbi:biotin transporter BioY [Maritalea sp.]|uniref:biotin transporter BioY n=1 Tax=Maritalea sp. TaxID=2003361 RepID=UPI003EF4044B
MAATTASRKLSLAEQFLPAEGVGRLLGYALMAVAGTIVLAAAAKVAVPFFPVPMTLTTLAILVIAGTYGFRLGLATIALYLLEGALGLPVFATGAGLAYMAGPTGGFLAGYIALTAIVGWSVDRGMGKNIVLLFAAMLVGEVVMFALGFSWLANLIGVEKSWMFGVQPFILGDLLKTAIAATLVFGGVSTLAKK